MSKKHVEMLRYFDRMANSIGVNAPVPHVSETHSVVQFNPAIWTAEEIVNVLTPYGIPSVIDDGSTYGIGFVRVRHVEEIA